VFIAVPVPEPVKDSIVVAQNELRDALPPKAIRWTKREQLHVTLRFLGEVESDRVDALILCTRRACERTGALDLRAGGIGMFPHSRRPRVLWTHAHERRERLTVLQRSVEDATAEFTSERAEKTFTGHVTLGRCHAITRAQAALLTRLARAMESRAFGEWTADRIDIVRSELGPGGSHYTTLAEVPLAV
jgi:2'-5' RNA ligase